MAQKFLVHFLLKYKNVQEFIMQKKDFQWKMAELKTVSVGVQGKRKQLFLILMADRLPIGAPVFSCEQHRKSRYFENSVLMCSLPLVL